MFYIIPNYYEPNTAATNRFLALLKGLSAKLDAEKSCEVEFFLPNNRRDKIVISYPNINIKYWWDSPWFFRNKYFKYISFRIAVNAFIRRLKAGDSVLLLGHVELLPWVQKKKGVRVYLEMNEYPELFHIGNGPFKISNEKLLQCCRKLNGLFVISYHLKDYFVEKGVNADKIHLYRMIVDPSRFEQLEKQKDGVTYIAYCGTAVNRKDGVNILIQAFPEVVKYRPDIQLYIIGATPWDKDNNENYNLIENLGLGNKVVFTGIVDALAMPQILKNAEVLVLARPDNVQSNYGFPTKLGEYLLSGNPVVVTSVGDIPRYLKDGENALLAIPDSPQSLADKIIWALEHKNDAIEIGGNGRKTALEFFNPQKEAEHILNIINS